MSDNSANRNKPGCVPPQREYLCHSEEEPVSPRRDRWNRNETEAVVSSAHPHGPSGGVSLTSFLRPQSCWG